MQHGRYTGPRTGGDWTLAEHITEPRKACDPNRRVNGLPDMPYLPLNTNPYPNVRFERNRWRCTFWHRNVFHEVGYAFATANDAARAYNAYIEVHGLKGRRSQDRKPIRIDEGIGE